MGHTKAEGEDYSLDRVVVTDWMRQLARLARLNEHDDAAVRRWHAAAAGRRAGA